MSWSFLDGQPELPLRNSGEKKKRENRFLFWPVSDFIDICVTLYGHRPA